MSSELTHLIIVAGNSVLRDLDVSASTLKSDDAWLLKDREKSHSVPIDILRHISKSIVILKGDSSSVLVFSGGATRMNEPWCSKLTEAGSYYAVAKELEKSRNLDLVLLDIHSYNSGHNVLFGINEFWRHTGQLPNQITVVTRDFKQERFGIYVAVIEERIGKRFDCAFLGVRDTDPDYARQSREYELNNQLPKLRKNPMRDFEELQESRTPGPQGIQEGKICPDLKELIEKCTKAATKA